MSIEVKTQITQNGGDEQAAGVQTRQTPPAKPADVITGMQDTLLEVLSTRSPVRKLWAKLWKRNHPELQKVYGVIHSHLVELQRLLLLRQADQNAHSKAVEQQMQNVLNENYRDLSSMNIQAAWEYAATLERFLLLLGDDEYLLTRLVNEEQREKKAKLGSWSEYLDPERLSELLGAFKISPVTKEARARAVENLCYLYAERSRYMRHQRAREDLKADYLNRLTFILTILLLLLLQSIYLSAQTNTGGLSKSIGEFLWSLLSLNSRIDLQHQVIRNALVAAATGALGSTLSGFYRLRDEQGSITALRSFRSAMWAQPFVGAVIGVVLWLLLKSGIVGLGATTSATVDNIPWSNLSIYCFLAGFSEPFFLGVVQRVAGAADKDGKMATKKETDNKTP